MDEHVQDETAPRWRIRMRWLLTVGGLALVAGFLGFREVSPTDPHLTSLYRAVQLFTFNSGNVEGTPPLLLELGRWVAPLCVLTGLLQAISSAVMRVWNEWRASRQAGHIVILGLGRKGKSIARGFLGRTPEARITGVDSDPAACAAVRGDPALAGVRTLCRDGGTNGALQLAAVARAKKIVIATESDVLNLRLAERVQQVVAASRRNRGTQLFVHIGDSSFRDELSASDALAQPVPDSAPFIPRPRLINHYAEVARRILRDFPLERVRGLDCARDPRTAIHLILTGLDDLQLALLVEAARIGHYLGDRKVHLHVLSREPEATRHRVLAAYPGLLRCVAGLDVARLPGAECSGEDVRRVLDGIPAPAMCTIVPANDTALEVHRETLRIRKAHATCATPHALRVLAPRPGSDDDWAERLHGSERVGPVQSEVGYYLEDLVAEAMDEGAQSVARRIHEAWIVEQEEAIVTGTKSGEEIARKATFRSWDLLRPIDQEANHSQALHAPIKLRAAGADPATETREDWLARLRDPELLERLARMEHERWMADRLLAGYQASNVRDDARRLHNDIKPYEALIESTRNNDREAVRKIGNYLEAIRREHQAEGA